MPDTKVATPDAEEIDYTTDATVPGATDKVADEAPAEPTPEPEPPAVPPDSVDGFATLSWNGKPLYQCTSCPFDTLDIAAARAHAAPSPKPTNTQMARRAGLVLTDRFGNPKE